MTKERLSKLQFYILDCLFERCEKDIKRPSCTKISATIWLSENSKSVSFSDFESIRQIGEGNFTGIY